MHPKDAYTLLSTRRPRDLATTDLEQAVSALGLDVIGSAEEGWTIIVLPEGAALFGDAETPYEDYRAALYDAAEQITAVPYAGE